MNSDWRKLKTLKETFRRMEEMPAWNDSDKSLGDELGSYKTDQVQFRKESGFELLEELNDAYNYLIWQRRDTIAVDIFDVASDTHIGEFTWYDSPKLGGYITESVAVSKEHQGKGIGFNTYMYVINTYMHTLFSDTTLTGEEDEKGSFHLWQKLAKNFDYVYIYNLEANTFTPVERFEEEHMGNENTRFVVSTEDLE